MTLSRLPHKHPEFSHFNIILNKPQIVLVFSRITHPYSMSRPVAFLYNKVISLREREQIIPIFYINKFALSFCWSCCVCGAARVVAGPPAGGVRRACEYYRTKVLVLHFIPNLYHSSVTLKLITINGRFIFTFDVPNGLLMCSTDLLIVFFDF